MIIPLVFTAIILWIQDAFLKGDKHAEERRVAQERFRKRWEKIHDMRREHAAPGAFYQFQDKEGEDEFVLIDESSPKQKSLIRQIEEGVYNIKKEDYDPNGNLSQQRRRSFQFEEDSDDEVFSAERIKQANANRSKSQFFMKEDRKELSRQEIVDFIGRSPDKKLKQIEEEDEKNNE